MDFLSCFVKRTPEYTHLMRSLKAGTSPISVTGLCRTAKSNIVSALPDDLHRRVVVVAPDEGAAFKLKDDLFSQGRDSVVLEARDLDLRSSSGASREYERSRAGTLYRLLTDSSVTLIATPDALAVRTIPPDRLSSVCVTLESGSEISPDSLCEKLIGGGYLRVDSVEAAGQFARRGGIVDVFTPAAADPVRIEFWGDEIDSISSFDVATQRRNDSTDSVVITPAREIILPSGS